ncbi:unnamed protein product [Vitrella brassicaformis CCMP3155]|uniref:Uncharacterized protein n=1 Tax=Vitrella brassicaformis (strain CCMP3155) TaxID=1169540 RepID=A0A0G4EDU9_VITBC|nr:unnamed protein product [Vitrella brassicaformis CCMP3155]|eukprot:CEL93912.1 unnamed protein product [Vitrella brassicaformis CCMP3155]
MTSLPALPGAGLSPAMAQELESVTHSKMKALEAFISRCNSEGSGDMIVVRSTIFDALEVENLVQGTLSSQLASHTKTKKTTTQNAFLRLSPSSSGGGTYDAVTVLRDISVAAWGRTKGGNTAIQREVADMIEKSRRPDPHGGGYPVHLGVLVEAMLDRLKCKKTIRYVLVTQWDMLLANLPLSLLERLTTDYRSKLAIIGLQTVSDHTSGAMTLGSSHGSPKYQVLRFADMALPPAPTHRHPKKTTRTRATKASSSILAPNVTALDDRFLADGEDDDDDLYEPRPARRAGGKSSKAQTQGKGEAHRVRKERRATNSHTLCVEMGLGGYGQQMGFGEGEGMHVCDMGPGMVSGLVEGTLLKDTAAAKATSVSPFELKKDRLPAGIPVHGHTIKDNPGNGPGAKASLADQLRVLKVKAPAPPLPLDSRPPISRRPGTLSSAEANGTDPSPLLPSKTISKTPSFPADDSQGDNSTPPKEDKRQVPEEHNEYSRTAQGSVRKSLAAELRRNRKVLSTHPVHTAIATASPPAKMTIDHSPVPSALLPSPTVSQHHRYRLSSPPDPPQEPDPFASGPNAHGMVLRQNRKKRTRSPLPSPSPTDSDHQPLPKAKRAAVRRPKSHEKDETPPVFGGLGEEVLWGPWNKGREGEIVKTTEAAGGHDAFPKMKRAPRGKGKSRQTLKWNDPRVLGRLHKKMEAISRASDWQCRLDLARCRLAAEEDPSEGGGDYEPMDIDEGAGAAGGADDDRESLAEWLGRGGAHHHGLRETGRHGWMDGWGGMYNSRAVGCVEEVFSG